MKSRAFLSALFAAALPILSRGAAHACAVCLTGDGSDPLTDAFNASVLFLMAAPYTVLGAIGGFLFYSCRRKAKRPTGGSEKATIAPLIWIHKESER